MWPKQKLKKNLVEIAYQQKKDFRYTRSTIFWASDPSLLIHTYKQVEM